MGFICKNQIAIFMAAEQKRGKCAAFWFRQSQGGYGHERGTCTPRVEKAVQPQTIGQFKRVSRSSARLAFRSAESTAMPSIFSSV